MANDFNNAVGAWPECYLFTDSIGKVLWKSEIGNYMKLENSIQYAKSKNWV